MIHMYKGTDIGISYHKCRIRVIIQSDVGVSLHSKTSSTVHVCSTLMEHVHTFMYTSIKACSLCFFYNPYDYVPF